MLFYLIFALPAILVAMAIYDYGIKKLKTRNAKIINTSILLLLIFTPVMGNGGIVAIPMPSYLLLFSLLVGDINSLMLNIYDFPGFLAISVILSLVASIAISLYINPNNSSNLTGAENAPPR